MTQLREEQREALRQAIKASKTHSETFETMLDTATGDDANEVVNAWFDEEARLKLEVGKAFVTLTSDINSPDKAKYVDVPFAIKYLEKDDASA